MQDFVMVTGMVIKTIPVGEYDRHVCILTKEKGKKRYKSLYRF